MPEDIQLAEVIRLHTDRIRRLMAGPLPGKVVTYYPEDQTADIEIQVKNPLPGDEEGEVIYEEFPVCPRVPIAFFRFGGCVIAGKVEAGNDVLMIFTELALGDYRATNQVSEPADLSRHTHSYPVALPVNLGVIANPLSPTDIVERAAGLVIGAEGHNGIAVFTESGISLGKGALAGGDTLAKFPLLSAALTAIQTALVAAGQAGAAGAINAFIAGGQTTLVKGI
jgi:hypothetical protein